jgi:sulfide dehydrogenase cytochrome subunit
MRIKNSVLSLLGILLTLPVYADGLDALVSDCNDCHGPDGVSAHPDVPTIAGQSYIVLEDALFAYAADERNCQESEYRHGDTSRAPVTMCALAAEISEDDISSLSEYYEGLPFVAAKQDFDAAQVERGAEVHERHCDRCHSEGGSYAGDDAGILAGQWTQFLRETTEEFIAGTRPMPKKMAERMERVDEADIEALLNYYASQGSSD